MPFADGDASMRDLLGGKGANLAEMARIGLPVPPGFIVTTEACRSFRRAGDVPAGLDDQVAEALAQLETATGRRLGDPDAPLTARPTSIKTLEWERIHEVLAETDFNISEAARRLGMHRRTLARKLEKRQVS
jgi:phosphoenolpyruvate synthase/pyruvate phosphate dikinase